MEAGTSAAPIILTNKQEAFAQLLAAGAPVARDAYMEAYGCRHKETADVGASRTLRSVRFQARLAQLQAQNAAALRVSVESITKMLVAAFDLSMAEKQGSAAAQAAMGLAKLHGMIIDRAQIDALIRKPAATPDARDEMSEEEWLRDYGGSTLNLPVLPPS